MLHRETRIQVDAKALGFARRIEPGEVDQLQHELFAGSDVGHIGSSCPRQAAIPAAESHQSKRMSRGSRVWHLALPIRVRPPLGVQTKPARLRSSPW